MPTVDPVDRLPPTTARVHLLLELTIAGFTHRIADEFLTIEHEDGSTLVYQEGLATDFEVSAAFFGDSLGEVSIPLSVVLPGVDLAELVSLGHDLAAGTAELSRWVEGTTYGQRAVLLRGVVSSPTFGAENEPLAFSLATLPLNEGAVWPPGDAVIDTERFPDAHESAIGKRYPWIFGTPGWWEHAEGGRIPGSPAYCIDADQDRWVIAAHPIGQEPGQTPTVWWRNMADSSSSWELAGVGTGATGLPDGKGYTLSWIQDLAIDFETTGVDVWISWAPLPCGWIVSPGAASLVDGETFTVDDGNGPRVFEFDSTASVSPGNIAITISGTETAAEMREEILAAINGEDWRIRAVRGPTATRVLLVNTTPGTAGNIVITDTVASGAFLTSGMEGGVAEQWRGGMRGPRGAIEGAGDLLEFWLSRSSLGIDRAAVGALRSRLNVYRVSTYVDEPTPPWEYVQAHFADILPISFAVGPNGIQPILWRYLPSEIDAIHRFDVDELEAERTGPVEVGDPGEVANRLTLAWARRADANEHVSSSTVDGSATEATYGARLSVRRYGLRERATESDLVSDAVTAARILGWQAAAFALPALFVKYEAPLGNVIHLALGDVVAVTDAELHLDARLFHVVGLHDNGTGTTMEVSLRSLEEPSRA